MGLESRIQRLESAALQSSKHVIAIREPGDKYMVNGRTYTSEEFEIFKGSLPKNTILHVVEFV